MLRRIKLDTGELHLIRDLHLHLQETGGGKSDAEALFGKRRQQCKGQGQSGPEWADLDEASRRPHGEFQGQNAGSRRCRHSASVHSGSPVFGVLALPGPAVAFLSDGCLQTSRIHFSWKSQELGVLGVDILGQPFSNADESGGDNSPTPLPVGHLPDLPCRNKPKLCWVGLFSISYPCWIFFFCPTSITLLLAFPGTVFNKWHSQEFLSLEVIPRYTNPGQPVALEQSEWRRRYEIGFQRQVRYCVASTQYLYKQVLVPLYKQAGNDITWHAYAKASLCGQWPERELVGWGKK